MEQEGNSPLSNASCLDNPAFLLFLSRFAQPNSTANLHPACEWEAALGADLSTAIARLDHEGFVRPVELDLPTLLSSQFGSVQLKEMAKERGLTVSGTKEILGKRLAEADAPGMARLIRREKVFVCTGPGLTAAEQFKASQKAKTDEAERDALDLLKSSQLREACLRVARYNAEQIIPRGIWMEFCTSKAPEENRRKAYDPTIDLAILTRVFSESPKRLAALSTEKLSPLRMAAAMTHLWGAANAKRWVEESYLGEVGWDSNVTAMMLLSYALTGHVVASGKALGFKKVKVLGSNNPMCPECTGQAGKVYDISNAPEIPFERCSCERGCACVIVVAD
jgi:hypothetical protein